MAGDVSRPTVTLTLEVAVSDREKLLAYAKQRYQQAWDDPGWAPSNLAEAVYEALIGSSEGPSPCDIGIEITDVNYELVGEV